MILLTLLPAFAGPDRDEERHYEFDAGFVAPVRMKAMGATPGGAQDIGHFRDLAARGVVPPEASITPEGLFSEHDLPLPGMECERLLCVTTAASPVALVGAPEVDALAQIGFSSGLSSDFRRPPLNLVAVVDQSCSMSDQPIETVRASLREVVRQLRPDDQLSVVLYGSGVHTHLAPTRDPERMRAAVDAIAIDGSTNMEAGLIAGFALARETRRTFDGVSRVMLFTDERPNVGNTHAEGFMGLAEAASAEGIGLTTIGVGVEFGSELATRVSSVRGGNLFFVGDEGAMKETFAEDFDGMVTELAYDLRLRVEPAPGARVVDVYGVPGDLVRRLDSGAVELEVRTVFLSRKNGAIFVGFDAEGPGAPGSVTLTYTARDGAAPTATSPFVFARGPAPVGLSRGALLVDEALALRAASRSWAAGDAVSAVRAIEAVSARFRETGDAALSGELRLLEDVGRALAPSVARGPAGDLDFQPVLVGP